MKIGWYFRQLLPLTYRSKYKGPDGKKHFSVWNMWMGKVFNHQDFVVAE